MKRSTDATGVVKSGFINFCAYASIFLLLRYLSHEEPRDLRGKGFRGIRVPLGVIPPLLKLPAAAARVAPCCSQQDCEDPVLRRDIVWIQNGRRGGAVPRRRVAHGHTGIGSNTLDGGRRVEGSRKADRVVPDETQAVAIRPAGVRYFRGPSGGFWAYPT